MKKKIGLLLLWVLLTIGMGYLIVLSEKNNCALGAAVAGALIAIFIEKVWQAWEDISDTTDWKTSQRQLMRGGIIRKDTIIRISFAYLYRIKVGNDYLLVKNARGTEKYQPVGGVYKLQGNERTELDNLFHVVDDNKVKLDESSRDDYRLQMSCRYLRKFVSRFNSKKSTRERIDNVGREFWEELGEVVNWSNIKYRYCGRHMTELKYSDHFQCYELLLADIVELLPTEQQRSDLEHLKQQPSDIYIFATAEEIKGLGIIPGTEKLKERIADHSIKILQETEQHLMREPKTGTIFEVTNGT